MTDSEIIAKLERLQAHTEQAIWLVRHGQLRWSTDLKTFRVGDFIITEVASAPPTRKSCPSCGPRQKTSGGQDFDP